MEHHFNVDLAKKYGILEAVILNHFSFWIAKNEANEKHFHDGRYWTYSSAKALHKMFPYASERQIRYAIQKLEDEGVVIKGNYNKSPYDRTMWYSLSEEAMSNFPESEIEVTDLSNENDRSVTPIPDIKTDKRKDIHSQVDEIVSYLNEKSGKHYRASSSPTVKCIHARLEEKFTVEDFKKVIDNKVAQWKDTDMDGFLRPQTLFGTKFESYLNEDATKGRRQASENAVSRARLEQQAILESWVNEE